VDRPNFFADGAEWRAWLERHHATAGEVWIGFHKVGSGRTGISNDEAVNQALCFGWIDGVVERIDERAWRKRFTPRRAGSHWSAVNVRRIAQLTEAGLMRPAGVSAFEARREERTAQASHERKQPARLDDAYERRLRANPAAAEFLDAQPPSYRRSVTHWIVSAKREETRRRRLEKLIECSAAGQRVPQFTRPGAR
jgi:uncharacterized protein YdeI (YjbR/CyaY-like superfamily)